MQAKESLKFGNSESQLKIFAQKQKIDCPYLHISLIFQFSEFNSSDNCPIYRIISLNEWHARSSILPSNKNILMVLPQHFSKSIIKTTLNKTEIKNSKGLNQATVHSKSMFISHA